MQVGDRVTYIGKVSNHNAAAGTVLEVNDVRMYRVKWDAPDSFTLDYPEGTVALVPPDYKDVINRYIDYIEDDIYDVNYIEDDIYDGREIGAIRRDMRLIVGR